MSLITVTPTNVEASTGWTNPSNAFDGNNGTYASHSGANLNPIRFYNFNDIDDLALANVGNTQSIIEGVKVTIRGYHVTSTTGKSIGVKLQLNGVDYSNTTIVGFNYTSSTTVEVWLRRKSDNTFIRRDEIRKEDTFSVVITPVTTGHELRLEEVSFQIEYFTSNQLKGESSTFPVEKDTFDLLVNGPSSTILNTDYIIKADQFNSIGDSIITTQRTLLRDSTMLQSLGLGRMVIGKDSSGLANIVLFNYIIRGRKLSEYYNKFLHEEGLSTIVDIDRTEIHSNQVNESTVIPNVQQLILPVVYGSGWVNNAGTILPLCVSPFITAYINKDDTLLYSLGYRVLPGEIGTLSGTYSNTTSPTITTTWPAGYSGDHPFEVRITAIGYYEAAP